MTPEELHEVRKLGKLKSRGGGGLGKKRGLFYNKRVLDHYNMTFKESNSTHAMEWYGKCGQIIKRPNKVTFKGRAPCRKCMTGHIFYEQAAHEAWKKKITM